MGGNNSVQVEKTLRKAALEQYLEGGFNQPAIIYQVTSPSRSGAGGGGGRHAPTGKGCQTSPRLP